MLHDAGKKEESQALLEGLYTMVNKRFGGTRDEVDGQFIKIIKVRVLLSS